METRRLGSTAFHLTPVGIGTWAIGGGHWDWGWGSQEDADSIAAICQGLAGGMNWIDTAPAYGLGHGEEIVARALEGVKAAVLVFTKCGNLWKEGQTSVYRDLRAHSIIEKVDDSLRRLKVDVIDLLQIHWPNEDLEEGWGAMSRLVEMGKIRYAGVCNCNLEQLQRIQRIHPVASLQNPYSLLDRGVEDEILLFCTANQIGFLAYSPLQAGLLTGKYSRESVSQLDRNDWRRKSDHFNEPYLSANLAFIDGLRSVAARLDLSLTQLAVAWVLRRPDVTAAIVGVRKPSHAAEAASAPAVRLGEDVLAEIDGLSDRRTAALALCTPNQQE